MKKRIDQYLVEHGYFPTRSRAQDAIKEGRVLINQAVVKKSSYQIEDTDVIKCIEAEHAFASRAGTKLYHALKHFQIQLKDCVVIDVGASTGGFSDVCLEEGAKLVYAVDVGKDQLLKRLRDHPRIKNFEGVNCRYLKSDMFSIKPTFACIDVSFISLKLILPSLITVMDEPFEIVALIKPQFEAGSKDVGKKGIVKDGKVHIRILQEMVQFVESLDLYVHHLEASSILGRDGNKEFVMHIQKQPILKVYDYKNIVKNY